MSVQGAGRLCQCRVQEGCVNGGCRKAVSMEGAGRLCQWRPASHPQCSEEGGEGEEAGQEHMSSLELH